MNDDSVHVRVVEGIQIVEAPDGTLVARSPEGVFDLGDIQRPLLELLLQAVGDGCTVAELITKLGDRVDPASVRALIDAYAGVMLEVGPRPASPTLSSVSVIGNSRLATTVVEHLQQVGADAELVAVSSVAGTDQSAAVRAAGPQPDPLDGAIAAATSEQLAAELAGSSLAVAALERLPYGALAVIAAAADAVGVPLLTVVPHPGAVVVGPLWAGGRGAACPTCVAASVVIGPATGSWSIVDLLHSAAIAESAGSQVLAAATAREVVELHHQLSSGELDRLALGSAIRLEADGSRAMFPVSRGPDCVRCGPSTRNSDQDLPSTDAGPLAAAMTVARAEADQRMLREPGPTPEDMQCRTVGVVGGGTAGYLTALALQHRFPALDVTLLESSQIGVIAVGEATTSRLLEFLHGPNGIGIDIVEFHEKVKPVWKLGVYYDWVPPDAPVFPWPFQYGNVADAVHHDGHLTDHCLGATLMHRARTPLVDVGGDQVLSMLREVPFAYHLDNNSFVSYLQEVATRRGVKRHDVTIERVEVGDDPSSVDALIAEDGRRFEFDLYVDCSGFGSLLLEKGLGSSWIGYDDSLFCDAAVVADTPNDGVVRPYTAADTMDAGWCWRIAFDDADHRGYVFSSAFLDPDDAAAEMRRRNPGMGDHWVARFRSGRHADWWRGNVVALGNAYGFIEPLASTALHLLVGGIDQLSVALTTNPGPARKVALSQEMGTAWDEVRSWVATQYRFNRRLDTDFWRECRSSVALHEASGRVERYKERAPLSTPGAAGREYFATDYSYDLVLAGQQIPARWAPPRSTPAEWHAHTARLRSIADRALSHVASREVLRRRPEILWSLQEDPEGWIQKPEY